MKTKQVSFYEKGNNSIGPKTKQVFREEGTNSVRTEKRTLYRTTQTSSFFYSVYLFAITHTRASGCRRGYVLFRFYV